MADLDVFSFYTNSSSSYDGIQFHCLLYIVSDTLQTEICLHHNIDFIFWEMPQESKNINVLDTNVCIDEMLHICQIDWILHCGKF
jgi:hypothetical protein